MNCPKCDGVLEYRKLRHDEYPFYLCSNFPRCMHTEEVPNGTIELRPLR